MMGSSTVIFGLLAICLVWAPRNEVTCIIWLRFTPMEIDLSILWFAVLYIALDVLTSGMSGVIMASLTDHSSGVILAVALAHTFGAILGFVMGVVLLKLKLVDCENWDLFAVLEGRAGKSKKQAKKLMRAEATRRGRIRSAAQEEVQTGREGPIGRAFRRGPVGRRTAGHAAHSSLARWRWRWPSIGNRVVPPPGGGRRNAIGAT